MNDFKNNQDSRHSNGSSSDNNPSDLVQRIEDVAQTHAKVQAQLFALLREVAVNQQKLATPQAAAAPQPKHATQVPSPQALFSSPVQPQRTQPPQNTQPPQRIQPPQRTQPRQQVQPPRPMPTQPPRPTRPVAATPSMQSPRPQQGPPQQSKPERQQPQRGQAQPQGQQPQRQQPHPQPRPAPQPVAVNRLKQWWEKEDLVTRLLAIIGGSITVVGLTFLALLAYASGVLSPEAAVVLAAVLCGGLAIASTVIHRRQPDGVGASALLVVATLGGLADLWVSVFQLDWFGEALGSVLTVVICAAALGLAYTWKKEILAVIITAFAPLFIVPIAAGFLSMFPADQMTQREIHNGYFAGSLLAAAICGFAARWGRPWFKLQITATITYMAALFMSAPFVLTTFLLGVVGFTLIAIISFVPPWATRQLHISSVIAVVVVPVLILSSHDSWGSIAFISVVTLFAYLIAHFNGAIYKVDSHYTANAPLPPTVATSFLFSIAAGTLPIIFVISFFRWQKLYALSYENLGGVQLLKYSTVAIAVALLLYSAAIVWGLPRIHKAVAWISLVCSFLVVFTYAPQSWVEADNMRIPDSAIVLVTSLALSVALAYRHKYLLDSGLQGIAGREAPGATVNPELILMCIGGVTLVLASSAVPAVAMAISATKLSFMIAHVFISVSWMLGAVYLLYRNNSKLGLILAIIATGKLVFYDLSVLGGLVQALAFLICGMVLLIAAVTREKPNKSNGITNIQTNAQVPATHMEPAAPTGSPVPPHAQQPQQPQRPAQPQQPSPGSEHRP
ncbi:hypothetical protein [uncultured Corynebacterium sp.]|uniref:hypothetical protein n=1 Tax=uncultured Corynebacterium sp. TaxID=159447 RepID=UPI002600E2D5|nr:hypothetical protein [uncultured Corynebacterium sp.]